MDFMQFLWILNINFNKIYYIAIFFTAICKIFIKLRCFFDPFKVTSKILSIHANYLRPNTNDTMILYFHHIFYVFIFSFHISMNIYIFQIYIQTLMPFSTINNKSILVNRSNFTLPFFKG